MLVTTDDVIAAWLSPSRQLSIRVKMNDVTYGSEDITSLSFDSGSISGETYQIGSTYMNSIQLVFPSIIETVKEDLEVVPELAVLVNGNYEYTKLGHFFIDEFERNRNSNTTTIKATDKMRFMEGPYESKLSYKKPYREVALEVANLAGVEINEASFSALGTAAINKPEGYTFRQAIGLIAQFEGGFASFNRNGELEIRRLAPTNFEITPESYMLKGFTKNEVSYRIGGITVKTGEEETDVIRVGSTNGSQVQLENKVMTQQLLNQIWELVKNLNYFPYELKWRGCPPLEAGDWIYVNANDGTKYSVPNLSYSITFNGGMSAESKATTSSSSQATYKYRGPLNQRIDYLDSMLSSNNWNSNYYDATEPLNPKEGDIWFKPNGQDREIWIYKNVDGVLDWVMEITSAGDPELLAAIEEAIQAGKDAEAAAVGAKEEAAAAKQAGENAANLAEQAGLDAQAAKDKADAIQIDVNGLVSDVSNINGNVTSISKKADEAYDKANAVEGRTATLETSVTGLTGRLTDIESTAGSTTKKLNELVVTVDGQKQILATVTTTAESALNKANVLETTVDGFTRTISSVQTDLATKITDQSYATSSSADVNIRKWTLIAKTKLIARYQDIRVGIDFIGSGAGNSKTTLGRIYLNHKQQAAMGQNSLFEISISDTSLVTANDLVAIEVTTSESLSEVWYYMKWSQTYTAFRMTPFSKAGAGTIEYMATQPFITELPPYNAIQYGVERGSLASNTETITKVNQVSETVDGHTQLIASTKTTADSALTKATQVETTANGLKTTISSVETTANTALTKATQVEQTADGLVSTVNRIDGGGTNLVSNGGFENDYVGWTQPTGFTITTNDSHSGSKSLAVSNTGSAGRAIGRRLNVPVVPGRKYEVSYWYKTTADANGVSGNQKLRIGQANGTLINALGWDGASTEWSQKSQIYTAGTNIFEWSITLTASHTVGTVWWDDISIVDVTDREATASQITQLSDTINLKVSKNDVVNQINLSTEGVLIAGNKIQIVGTTYIADAVIKSGNIADLAVTSGKIANLAVTEGKIGNAAITTAKIGDLSVSTAKIADGAIINAKIGNAAITNAKIADATISSAKIISLDANKIVANNLAAITANTGTLNVSGYLNILNQDTGMYGSYDYGDSLTGSYNPRWYTGSWRIGNNLFRHTADIFSLTTSGGKGTRQGYFETSYGSDYVAMRKYNTNTSMTMSARVDINSDRLQVSNSWNETSGVILSANGEMSASEVRSRGAAFLQSTLDVAGAAYLRSNVDISGGLITRSTADLQGSVITRSRFEFQGSLWLTGDSYINSMPTYNRTTSSAANLMVTSNGYFARSTSARKYKTEIEVASDVIAKAKKVLSIRPASWMDKAEIARGEVRHRYYGFIADEFDAAGLTEVVSYGDSGLVESLAYDRLSIYHNVILGEHEREIQTLKMENVRLLAQLSQLESRLDAVNVA